MAILTFTNNTGLTINDNADVSQTVDVYGLTLGSVTGVSVSLVGLTHAHSDDLDMLLVGASPGRNLAFWTDIGSDIPGPANDLTNLSVTISDSGATALPNDSGVPVSGVTYKPASYDLIEGDTAFGLTSTTILHPASNGSATFGSAFTGFVANGTWTLIVSDDRSGDAGTLQGWGLTIVTNSISIGQVGFGVADTLNLIFSGMNSGSYSHNGRPVVGFSGVSNVTFEGLGGNDTLNMTHAPGSAQFYSFVADTIIGSFPTVRYFDLTEVVNLTTGSGADTFEFFDATSAVINIFAGAGADRIAIFNSQDLTESTITGVETLQFGDVTLLAATLLGSQFGAGKITTVQGDIGIHNLIVNAASDVDLSGVTFATWTAGADTITINGTVAGEKLTGSSQFDTINGGVGLDTLTGLAGKDTFVFDAAVSSKAIAAANADIITDFNPADDTIELAAAVFPKLKLGVLKNKAFDSGKKKPKKDKHAVYYDEKKGDLWYDANGKKQKGKGDVLVATLDPGLDLTAADIVVA